MTGVGRLLVILLALAPMFWARPACACTGESAFCLCGSHDDARGSPRDDADCAPPCCAHEREDEGPAQPRPAPGCPCRDCHCATAAARDLVPPASPVAPPATDLLEVAEVALGAEIPAPDVGIAIRAVHPREPPDLLSSVVLVI